MENKPWDFEFPERIRRLASSEKFSEFDHLPCGWIRAAIELCGEVHSVTVLRSLGRRNDWPGKTSSLQELIKLTARS